MDLGCRYITIIAAMVWLIAIYKDPATLQDSCLSNSSHRIIYPLYYLQATNGRYEYEVLPT
jgi:hypothetical protein